MRVFQVQGAKKNIGLIVWYPTQTMHDLSGLAKNPGKTANIQPRFMATFWGWYVNLILIFFGDDIQIIQQITYLHIIYEDYIIYIYNKTILRMLSSTNQYSSSSTSPQTSLSVLAIIRFSPCLRPWSNISLWTLAAHGENEVANATGGAWTFSRSKTAGNSQELGSVREFLVNSCTKTTHVKQLYKFQKMQQFKGVFLQP